MKYVSFILCSMLTVISASAAAEATLERLAEEFTLHRIFSSHMVLQRNRPIRFSGTAPAGESVIVAFADRTVRAAADSAGEWTAEFPAMEAGVGGRLEISGANSRSIVLDDILIGEVWLCSGQSNMEMPLWSESPYWRAMNSEQEVTLADYPQLRLFQAAKFKSADGELAETGGKWEVCTPEVARSFSALGYFFGRNLLRELDMPVGIINASYGGTRIEPWISEQTYRQENAPEAAAIQELRKVLPEERGKVRAALVTWLKRFHSAAPETTRQAQEWKKPDFDDSGWEEAAIPNGVPSEIDGVIWFRKSIDLPAGWAGRELVLNLGIADDCDETFFNGVKVGETSISTPNYWEALRSYRIPAETVQKGRNLIAVRVSDIAGPGGLQGPPREMYLVPVDEPERRLSLASGWKSRLEFAVDPAVIGFRPLPEPPEDHSSVPATLFSGMIAPWTKFPIRGILWYQGCHNVGELDYYRLHRLLIQDWRNRWNNPAMPFLLVQLAGYANGSPEHPLPDDFWKKQPPANDVSIALTREIQAEMQRLPGVGLATAIDIGEHSDIHPRDKQTLAWRLCREALRVAYGSRELSQGPIFDSMKIEGNSIRVFFRNVGRGLATSDGNPPGAFAVAGEDGKLAWADARIDGDTVVVSSPTVKAPRIVRYGYVTWRGDLNFCNKNGFPALPFRSDKPFYP